MSTKKPVTAQDLRLAGMDFLARREHGRDELALKLRRRFSKRDASVDLIDACLDQLVADGLLDERRFGESLLRQLLAKGMGPFRVRAELRQRGVPEVVQADLESQIEAADWCELAEAVYRRKYGLVGEDLAGDSLRREQGRRIRFMQYRGFESDHYRHLIDELGKPQPSESESYSQGL